MLKKLVILILILAFAFGASIHLALSDKPSIISHQSLSTQDIKSAQSLASQLMRKVTKQTDEVSFSLPSSQLKSLAMLASHVTPNTEFVVNHSKPFVSVNTSTELSYKGYTRYVNLRCLLLADSYELNYEECYIGSLYIPNGVAKFLIEQLLDVALGQETAQQIQVALNRAEVTELGVDFTLPGGMQLKRQLKNSVSQVTSLTTSLADNLQVDAELLKVYLAELEAVKSSNSSLSFYINKVFSLAQQRSSQNDPVAENTAAIWALALTNGSTTLKQFASIPTSELKPTSIHSTLHNRRDLTQHFLFSAVLHQLGETSFAHSIGQLKELADSDGGTGFSFADMTANKAGMAFSKYATSSSESALSLQQSLKDCDLESCFIPHVNDMPEGLNAETFESKYVSVKDEEYQLMETEIDQRIAQLPIYQ